jgi:hypothetical protein
MFEIVYLLIVGFLWGSTNYLIELYFYDYEYLNEKNLFKKIFIFLRLNFYPIIFTIINQTGSILFYFCLGKISKFKIILQVYR